MKLLIIKNDGFGDFLIVKELIKNILNNSNFLVDLVITKKNKLLAKDLHKIKNIYKFDTLCHNFSHTKEISENDQLELQKIKNEYYDQCIVLRKFLNDEQIQIMNNVHSKKKYTCYQSKSDLNIKLKEKWNNIFITNECVHDYEYYKSFLDKILLIKSDFIPTNNNVNFKRDNFLLINLSGERGFSNFKDIKFFLDSVIDKFKGNIIVIGKSFDLATDRNIKKYLSENLKNFDQKIKNLYGQTNFEASIEYIKNCSLYIGFDTGLSHYAAMTNVNALILLASGGNFRFWPYPKNVNKNISYIIYNTVCSGCNYAGLKNNCFFNTRKCIDGILNFPEKFNKYLQKFLINEEKFFINFSSLNYFISDWNFYKSKISRIVLINQNGELKLLKKNFIIFLILNLEWIKFLIKNNLFDTNNVKLYIKNIISFFYSK